jgi:hypothetical protein
MPISRKQTSENLPPILNDPTYLLELQIPAKLVSLTTINLCKGKTTIWLAL